MNKDKKQPDQEKHHKVTPASIISACLGLGMFALGLTGVANGKPGGYYLMGLGLLFVAAIGITVLKK
ncbi:MAG: hypothetical protein JEZ02_09750 [Desulfatibacillum sp.]|nr:hypothetical protein [Desulfatibacillum sp.]